MPPSMQPLPSKKAGRCKRPAAAIRRSIHGLQHGHAPGGRQKSLAMGNAMGKKKALRFLPQGFMCGAQERTRTSTELPAST